MVIRRDTVRLGKGAGRDADVVDVRDGGDDGVGMDIEAGFCQLAEGRKVARSEIFVATRVDTEDENFSPFHVLCLAPLSGILLGCFACL